MVQNIQSQLIHKVNTAIQKSVSDEESKHGVRRKWAEICSSSGISREMLNFHVDRFACFGVLSTGPLS